MNLSNQRIGKIVQWLGRFSVAQALFAYGSGLAYAESDPSVRAYSWLIALEVIFFVGVGLVVVWLGCRIAKPSRVPDTTQPEPPEKESSQ